MFIAAHLLLRQTRTRLTAAVAVALAALLVASIAAPAPGAGAAATVPVVASVSPVSGPVEGGTLVTVRGSGFLSGGSCSVQAWFGGASSAPWVLNAGTNLRVVSDSLLRVRAPASNAGTVDVVVGGSDPTCPKSTPNAADRYRFAYLYNGVCQAGETCTVTVNGRTQLGPAQRVADGFLHGYPTSQVGDACASPSAFTPTTQLQNELQTVNPAWWRISSHDFHDYDLPHALGANLIELLSDDWYCDRLKAGDPNAATPWKELDAFSTYVHDFVSNEGVAGHIEYWEIMNEPGKWPFTGGTTSDYLAVLKTGFEAARSADPTAKVVGPSLKEFTDKNRCVCELDLTTFLDFAQANNLDFAAVAWHEIGNDFPGVQHPLWSPDLVTDHVAAARSMLAARPVVRGAKVFVDEYAPGDNSLIPGWAVGFISAFERANVDAANRACWWDGSGFSECNAGVDGLFTQDTKTPQALYWVYAFYGQMHGTRVSTKNSASDITAFATRDDSTRTLRALAGRHVNCAPAPAPNATTWPPADPCNQGGQSTAGPAAVNVKVTVPYALSQMHLHVERIPNWRGAVPATILVSDTTVPVQHGAVSVSIPSFVDGDAYTITLSPSA